MRVLIAEAQTLQFRADAALPLRVRGLGGQERSLQRLSVSLRGGSLLLDGLGQAPSLRVSTDDPRGLWLGQRRYRGDVLLLPRGGRVLAINRLGIETYLPSVVGSEMPASWPLPALQAGVIGDRVVPSCGEEGGRLVHPLARLAVDDAGLAGVGFQEG